MSQHAQARDLQIYVCADYDFEEAYIHDNGEMDYTNVTYLNNNKILL